MRGAGDGNGRGDGPAIWGSDCGGARGGRLVVLRVAVEELRPELSRGCAGSSEGLRRELEWCWQWLEVIGKVRVAR
ncbi:unnamed protein product [Sphenostylis stenocarpa]|uniref:Uncharacterized protein n=1 Tax=Sphenostylis stenocarpa TaxID=92480 RepID=A0AA86VZE3_9FABA|nr:unnamed protein product [Sphenostylis stenocarpa]